MLKDGNEQGSSKFTLMEMAQGIFELYPNFKNKYRLALSPERTNL